MNYLSADYGLYEKREKIDQALKDYLELAIVTGSRKPVQLSEASRNYTRRLLTLSHIRLALGVDRSEYGHRIRNPKYDLFRGVLAEAKRTVSTWDGRLVFVYLPDNTVVFRSGNYVGAAILTQERFLSDRDIVLKLVRELDIQVVPVFEALEQLPDPAALYPLGFIGHFSAKGYRFVGEMVVRNLACYPDCRPGS